MKLPKDISLRTYTYVTHPLFGFLVPLLFTTMFALFIDTLATDMVLFSPGVVIVMIIATAYQIGMTFKFHFFDFKPGDRLGEILGFLAVLYVILGIFKQGSLSDRFAIQGWDLYYLGTAAMSWFVSNLVYKLFKGKEKYLSEHARFEDPKNKHNHDLKKVVEVFSSEAYHGAKFITITLAVLSLVIAFFFLFVNSFGRAFPPAGPIIALIFLFTGALLYLHEKIFLEMKILLADTIHVPEKVKNNRFALAAVLILGCITFGLVVSGDTSLYNIFTFLDSIWPKEDHGMRYRTVVTEEQNITHQSPDSLEFGEIVTIVDLSFLNDLLMIIIPIAGVLLFAFIIFKSVQAALENKGRREKRSFLKVIGDFFIRIGCFFAQLFAKNKDVYEFYTQDDEYTDGKGHSFFKSKKDRLKKQEEKHFLVKELHKVFKWGKKQKYPYYSSDTLSEYISTLKDAFPNVQEELSKLVGIFNEGMFSKNILPEDKIVLYRSLVKQIVTG